MLKAKAQLQVMDSFNSKSQIKSKNFRCTIEKTYLDKIPNNLLLYVVTDYFNEHEISVCQIEVAFLWPIFIDKLKPNVIIKTTI